VLMNKPKTTDRPVGQGDDRDDPGDRQAVPRPLRALEIRDDRLLAAIA
jgi:hypothetical protein